MKEILDRLHWPQVAAFAVFATGVVVALTLVPPSTWAAIDWRALASLIAVVIGGGTSAALQPMLRPKAAVSMPSIQPPPMPSLPPSLPPNAKEPPRPQPRKPTRMGFVRHSTMIAFAALGVVLFIAGLGILLPGCGASAPEISPIFKASCSVIRGICTAAQTACGIADVALPTAGGEGEDEDDAGAVAPE